MKNGINIKTIGLSLLIISLFTGIIIVFNLLTKEEAIKPSEKNINKVAEKTYSKNISLNSAISPAPTTIIAPTTNITMSKALSPTPKPTLKLSPTITITPTPLLRSTLSPTAPTTPAATIIPTDVVVAKNNVPSVTIAPTRVQATSTPRVIKSLPTAGYLNYSLIIIIVAALIITVSFVF